MLLTAPRDPPAASPLSPKAQSFADDMKKTRRDEARLERDLQEIEAEVERIKELRKLETSRENVRISQREMDRLDQALRFARQDRDRVRRDWRDLQERQEVHREAAQVAAELRQLKQKEFDVERRRKRIQAEAEDLERQVSEAAVIRLSRFG